MTVDIGLLDGDYQNLMASSDEEEVTPQRLEMEKKKSNHELLLVIFESIRENYKDKPDIQTYRKLLRVLYQEKEDSEELRIALRKLREAVNKDEDLTAAERTVILLESQGLFSPWNLQIPEVASKFIQKVIKLIKDEEKQAETLEWITELDGEKLKLLNTQKEFLTALATICKSCEVDIKLAVKLLAAFNLKVSGRLRDVVEESKFDYRVVNIYLEKIMKDETNYQRLKYLEDFVKKLSDPSKQAGISAVAKIEVSKKVLSSIIDYLKDKDFGEDKDMDEVGRYKYTGQYFKVLLSVTKLNKELMEFLGAELVSRWFCFHTKDKMFMKTVTDVFWPLKKQCPTPLFLFIIQNSSTVSSGLLIAQQTFSH